MACQPASSLTAKSRSASGKGARAVPEKHGATEAVGSQVAQKAPGAASRRGRMAGV